MKSKLAGFFRRNSVTISAVIIAGAFAGILYFQAVATSKLQHQVEVQQQIIKSIEGITGQINDKAKQRTQQIDQLNRHLDCIVVFFAQPDRAQKSISDIDTCTLQNNNTGEQQQQVTGILLLPTPTTNTNDQVASQTQPAVGVVPPIANPQTEPSPAPALTPSPAPAVAPTPDQSQSGFLEKLLSPVNNLLKRL